MNVPWKDSVYLQRARLARLLHQPLARVAEQCAPVWGERERLDAVLADALPTIPHCAALYCLGLDGVQTSDNVGPQGIDPAHFRRDRSQRPYMTESVPAWGFLLSDAYISLSHQRPSLTALQLVRTAAGEVGYVGADFDLRNLPATRELYEDPGEWRQVKGDPAIRGALFQQCRVESPLDRNIDEALAILEELLTERGVFQCQIHFSSSQATIWTLGDPFRYRILDHEALHDPDICLAYPARAYPSDAAIPPRAIARILARLQALRTADENIYLRTSSINVFNGMVSLTFSCDGSHYLRWDEFLGRDAGFWFGVAA